MRSAHGVLFSVFLAGCGSCSSAGTPAGSGGTASIPTQSAPTDPDAPSEAEIQGLNAERKKLVAAGRLDEAEKVCAAWIGRKSPTARAEGYKCSANVLVRRGADSGGSLLVSADAQRLAVGGLALPPRLSGEPITKALDQLDQAAILNPSDLSIHQGRMFLALESGNYARTVTNLEASLQQYEDSNAALWLDYMKSFPRAQAQHAVAYLKLLSSEFPEDAAVLAQLGAWSAAAGNAAEAKQALEAALARDERNAMAHWRLGEVLESLGDRTGADTQYKRSLAIDGELAEERQAAYERFKSPPP